MGKTQNERRAGGPTAAARHGVAGRAGIPGGYEERQRVVGLENARRLEAAADAQLAGERIWSDRWWKILLRQLDPIRTEILKLEKV